MVSGQLFFDTATARRQSFDALRSFDCAVRSICFGSLYFNRERNLSADLAERVIYIVASTR